MPFVKVVKNNAYFKRFQTAYKRRREGKTDYKARRRLVLQDKNKYNTPKYRMVVRLTNKDVIAQVTYARVDGDYIVSAAYAHELPLFGGKVGLTNYAACYATGLLVARRTLAKYNLASKYPGAKEATGKTTENEEIEDGPRPFKAVLDIGLVRTTTGNRVFGVMKGALDGGMNIPHSEKRFPGFDKEKGEVNSDFFRKRILGGHCADHQASLQKEDAESYKKEFSAYVKAGVKPGDIEKMWKDCHAAIRKDPTKCRGKSGKKYEDKSKKRLITADRIHKRTQKKLALQRSVLAAEA